MGFLLLCGDGLHFVHYFNLYQEGKYGMIKIFTAGGHLLFYFIAAMIRNMII